jgi:hypothetical protein
MSPELLRALAWTLLNHQTDPPNALVEVFANVPDRRLELLFADGRRVHLVAVDA